MEKTLELKELRLDVARSNLFALVENTDDIQVMERASEDYRRASDEFYRELIHHSMQ